MYIVRDIFQLKYGHYREAKILLDEAYSQGLMPDSKSSRVLTDFTGESYRLIFESGFDSLADFEKGLSEGMQKTDWKKWYEKFKVNVESGHREILKQVI